MHQGTADWGHYIAFVRSNNTSQDDSNSNDVWYKCDDDRVSEVTFDTVFAESIGDAVIDGAKVNGGKTAYMLFYSKVKSVSLCTI